MTEMVDDTRTPEEREQAAELVAAFIRERNERAAQAPNPLAPKPSAPAATARRVAIVSTAR